MGRKRAQRGGKRKRGGGVLTGLRGGFQNVARKATGVGEEDAPARPRSRTWTIVNHVFTVALVLLVAALFLNRCGIVSFR